jgi:hypothetical protein
MRYRNECDPNRSICLPVFGTSYIIWRNYRFAPQHACLTKQSRTYFLWDRTIPSVSRATSIPMKYLSCPKSFNSELFTKFRLQLSNLTVVITGDNYIIYIHYKHRSMTSVLSIKHCVVSIDPLISHVYHCFSEPVKPDQVRGDCFNS